MPDSITTLRMRLARMQTAEQERIGGLNGREPIFINGKLAGSTPGGGKAEIPGVAKLGGARKTGSSQPKSGGAAIKASLKQEIAQQKAVITGLKSELAHHPRDVDVWNYYQARINQAEEKIRSTQRQLGTLPAYKTKMPDAEFRDQLVRTVQAHTDGSGFANIRQVQQDFKQQYGMSPKEFSTRMNDVRELSSAHPTHTPVRLYYEEDDAQVGRKRAPHFWNGQAFYYVHAEDVSKSQSAFFVDDPYYQQQTPNGKGTTTSAKSTRVGSSAAVKAALAGTLSADFGHTVNSDPLMSAILKEQGFDGLPQVVSSQQLDAYIQQGEQQLLRGVARVADGAAFQSGPMSVGHGIFGSGTYAATGDPAYAWQHSLGYASPENSLEKALTGTVLRMSIKSDAKAIDLKTLRSKQNTVMKASLRSYNKRINATTDPATQAKLLQERDRMQQVLSNEGRYAALLGYDVINVPNLFERDHWAIVLNRTAVRVDSQLYDPNGTPPAGVA